MKFQNPFLFCILFALSLFVYKKLDLSKPGAAEKKDGKLILGKGALAHDRFEITPPKINNGIKNRTDQKEGTYSEISGSKLDSPLTQYLFENMGNAALKIQIIILSMTHQMKVS